jgi:hypothetical protein
MNASRRHESEQVLLKRIESWRVEQKTNQHGFAAMAEYIIQAITAQILSRHRAPERRED